MDFRFGGRAVPTPISTHGIYEMEVFCSANKIVSGQIRYCV